MQKKKALLIGLFLTLTVCLVSVSTSQAVTFIEDSVDDIIRYQNGEYLDKGNFNGLYDEIDIVSLKFIGIELSLNLEAQPMNDIQHLYYIIIVWDDMSGIKNQTEIFFGSINGITTIDLVNHTLVNSTGQALPTQPSPINSSTIISGNSLVWEMDVKLFADMGNPEYVNATASFKTDDGINDYLYVDSYLQGEGPIVQPEPTLFNKLVSILGTILVCSFAGYTIGSIAVYYMTTNVKAKEKNTIFMAVFVLALAILVNVWFWLTPWQILWNIGVFLLAIVFGYLWATRGIMKLKFDAPLPDNLPIETDEDKGAVIVLSKGEADDYNPLALIRKFYKNKETGVPQKGKYLQPFALFKAKQKYKYIYKEQQKGISKDDIRIVDIKHPYRTNARKIAEKLEESFLDYDLYLEAFVDDWPTINQSLLTVMSRGANRIAILKLFTEENYEYDLALEEMAKIDYSEIGVKIAESDFLKESEVIQELIAKKVYTAIPSGVDKSSVGILLISEGQPKEWDSLYPLTEGDIQFKNAIKKKLVSKGLVEEKIQLAWILDRSPTMSEGFNALVQSGCSTIIAVPSSSPIECVNSLYDIPVEMAKLAKENDVKTVNITAWNDNDEFIQAYLGLIASAKEIPLKELGKNAQIILQSSKIGASLEKEENTEKDD
ncbi:MAG: hypothetical protein FK734_05470 [Asgard group archaeon]|nr:hypothetical protein [Asgard group archaeon]